MERTRERSKVHGDQAARAGTENKEETLISRQVTRREINEVAGRASTGPRKVFSSWRCRRSIFKFRWTINPGITASSILSRRFARDDNFDLAGKRETRVREITIETGISTLSSDSFRGWGNFFFFFFFFWLGGELKNPFPRFARYWTVSRPEGIFGGIEEIGSRGLYRVRFVRSIADGMQVFFRLFRLRM